MPDIPIWLDTLYFEGDRLLEETKHFRGKGGRAKDDSTNTRIVDPDPASCSSYVTGPDSNCCNASQRAETFAAGTGCTAPAEALAVTTR